ncbi:DUF2075 domain-containing protein [Latilactobacillus curvatus]|uniref:DUF2075 domain-containing protein n=1 Tax=Latilactobacillus curvatus TaxID=28038 RepID=UPI00097827FC|nr:DUF2075 domain-containing protein [Latilactobacillus curvatus]MCT3524573.1 DUF2075 domain-containing protein [Latilactobacillus curvatus]UTB70688.1 ATP-dependent exonuclease [Latilactobacillus curvatus]UTB72501.1 ATP-dependent exonuclease [Latilactobacillus curvatus]UTB74039.1 ATP-dependent exonuclease [Latilactobacillus curvatus]UTY79917.1 ATP-dependent exonuclease [Latilactobacillus curvatus]
MSHLKPIIYDTAYNQKALDQMQINEEDETYILKYPTVYIVKDADKQDNYSVYVGETTDIKRRTVEHITNDSKDRADWWELNHSNTAEMYVIGHEHFNKSMTLDIENKMMQYMASVDVVKRVNNRRTNQQNLYYSHDEMEKIFSEIWLKLRKFDKRLFPLERTIRDSALFKASPFHKLTDEQLDAKDKIMATIETNLKNRTEKGKLIIVEGDAGSGKTVLMSSLFYELNQLSKDESENPILRGTSQFLLVNHDQQLKVYEEIAQKLGIYTSDKQKTVLKPTPFINKYSENEPVDVVIVDEAHLLLTQGKQSYTGKNQLDDLLKRARVVVAVFDKKQILSREQYWEADELDKRLAKTKKAGNLITLNKQLRINAGEATIDWIRSLIDQKSIKPLPKKDEKGYEIKFFDSPKALQDAIITKAKDKDSGISRILATFDWPYSSRKDDDGHPWYVKIGDWKMPWNLQVPAKDKVQKKCNKKLAWAEQPQTIDEVGSTFTIQGFDLNYAGVIIGPSVKYRGDKIIFDKTASENSKAIQRRTLKNGKPKDVSKDMLRNELNVLLSRGVNGLYIYAVDDELRAALKKGI